MDFPHTKQIDDSVADTTRLVLVGVDETINPTVLKLYRDDLSLEEMGVEGPWRMARQIFGESDAVISVTFNPRSIDIQFKPFAKRRLIVANARATLERAFGPAPSTPQRSWGGISTKALPRVSDKELEEKFGPFAKSIRKRRTSPPVGILLKTGCPPLY